MTIKLDSKNSLRTAWKLSTDAEWPFESEHVFHPVRKWRFDWASIDLKLAIEIEGVTYKGPAGRHQRASGLTEDCHKYNSALALGWRVVRVTPAMINDDPVGVVEQILAVAEHCKNRK